MVALKKEMVKKVWDKFQFSFFKREKKIMSDFFFLIKNCISEHGSFYLV